MTQILQNGDATRIVGSRKSLTRQRDRAFRACRIVRDETAFKRSAVPPRSSPKTIGNFLLEGCSVKTRRGRRSADDAGVPFLQSRFSDNDPRVQLELYAHGAAMLMEFDWSVHLSAHLFRGETHTQFRARATRFVRNKTGKRLLWFGAYSSDPLPHVHWVVSAPQGSPEREALMDFLCKRGNCSRFELWTGGSGLPVHLQAINWNGRYKGLRGLTTYIKHHFDDVHGLEGQYAVPAACREVSRAAEELSAKIRYVRSLPPEPAQVQPEALALKPDPSPWGALLPQTGQDPIARQFQEDKAMLVRVCWRIMQEQGRVIEEVGPKLMAAWKRLRFGTNESGRLRARQGGFALERPG